MDGHPFEVALPYVRVFDGLQYVNDPELTSASGTYHCYVLPDRGLGAIFSFSDEATALLFKLALA